MAELLEEDWLAEEELAAADVEASAVMLSAPVITGLLGGWVGRGTDGSPVGGPYEGDG